MARPRTPIGTYGDPYYEETDGGRQHERGRKGEGERVLYNVDDGSTFRRHLGNPL